MAALNKKFKTSIKDLNKEDPETFHLIDEYFKDIVFLLEEEGIFNNKLTDEENSLIYEQFKKDKTPQEIFEMILEKRNG